jgi:hypothetical protein
VRTTARKLVVGPLIVVAIAGAYLANRSGAPARTVRFATVRPDGQPVAEDSDGGHEIVLASGCGVERWPVKTGTDASRYKVNTTPVSTSIAYLGSRPKPSSYPQNSRIAPYELHTYQLTAWVTAYKLEVDSDIHLIVKDSAGRAMIAEIPNPPCVGTTSRWRSLITSARSVWTTHYHTTTTWHYLYRSITLRGLGFFDPPHGQSGHAPNYIELHPIIYIHLN